LASKESTVKVSPFSGLYKEVCPLDPGQQQVGRDVDKDLTLEKKNRILVTSKQNLGPTRFDTIKKVKQITEKINLLIRFSGYSDKTDPDPKSCEMGIRPKTCFSSGKRLSIAPYAI